jgi:hypothetical protein
MIDDVIGPGLRNPDQFCYINAWVQTLFHILPLRLLVVGWPNGEPIITKLRAVFVVMAQGKMRSAVSMEQICEEHVQGQWIERLCDEELYDLSIFNHIKKVDRDMIWSIFWSNENIVFRHFSSSNKRYWCNFGISHPWNRISVHCETHTQHKLYWNLTPTDLRSECVALREIDDVMTDPILVQSASINTWKSFTFRLDFEFLPVQMVFPAKIQSHSHPIGDEQDSHTAFIWSLLSTFASIWPTNWTAI